MRILSETQSGLYKTVQLTKHFFTAPFKAEKMDMDYFRGVWMPFLINFLTKGSSKPIEQEGGLNSAHLTHPIIWLTLLNVLTKALSMSTVLKKDQSSLIRAFCFFVITGFDVLINALFAKDEFKSAFPEPSHEVEKESWIFLALLNISYMAFVGYKHYHEQQTAMVQTNTFDRLEAGLTEEQPAPQIDAEPQTCQQRLNTVINNIQLPLKFFVGVTVFFYGMMLSEKHDWKLQLPVSSVFYGLGMAATQLACNLLKQENNWKLVLYALACGPAEGVAYYSAIRFLPEELHTIYKALIVSVTTSAAIMLAGNMMFAFLNCAQQPQEDTSPDIPVTERSHLTNESPAPTPSFGT